MPKHRSDQYERHDREWGSRTTHRKDGKERSYKVEEEKEEEKPRGQVDRCWRLQTCVAQEKLQEQENEGGKGTT